VSGERVILRHEDVSASATVAFGLIVEASIGVGAEYHVTAAICGAIVRVGGEVVKKLDNGFSSGFSGSGLLGAQGAESGKVLVVDSLCIVEKGANDAFDSFDAFVGERRTVGFVVGNLGDLAVDNFAVLVRGELALGRYRMVVFDVDVVDVAWHGGSACAFGVCWAVVPF
jgi:hypothetical protein